MKRIIYSNPDGSVAVVIPAPDYAGTMADLAAAVVPNGIAFAIVEHTDIPSDRTFRAAWKKSGKTIAHDLPTVKAIWKDRWREARKSLLADLDVQSIKAQEDGDAVKLADVKAKKQALRDVTTTALPDDVDEIKSVWPEILTI